MVRDQDQINPAHATAHSSFDPGAREPSKFLTKDGGQNIPKLTAEAIRQHYHETAKALESAAVDMEQHTKTEADALRSEAKMMRDTGDRRAEIQIEWATRIDAAQNRIKQAVDELSPVTRALVPELTQAKMPGVNRNNGSEPPRLHATPPALRERDRPQSS